MSPHYGQAYGLTIKSDLPLPELPVWEGDQADVIIQLGVVPDQLNDTRVEGVVYQANRAQFLLKIPSIAHYLVENGRTITIQPATGTDDASIRLFLLETAFEALLQQCGVLSFMASAISTPKGAVLFMGGEGAGKSVMAYGFARRGYELLTDHLSALRIQDKRLRVQPALPHVCLWGKMMRQFGLDPQQFERIRPQLEKYRVGLPENFHTQREPLYTCYSLEGNARHGIELEALSGIEKPHMLYTQHHLAHTWLRVLNTQEMLLAVSTAARVTRCVRVKRSTERFELEQLLDVIEEDFRA